MSDSESGEEGSGTHGLRERFRKELDFLKSTRSHAPSDRHQAKPTRSDASRARAEPRVLHGRTAVKGIPFRTVCEAIKEHAFISSDLPIIVSLEVHTCVEQQLVMVDIMKETWGPHLIDTEITGKDEIYLPRLENIRRKILIKVKYSSPTAAAKKETPITSTSSAREHESSEEEAQIGSVKKGKIIPELGSMGIYTRSAHFKSFDQPEAKLPTHIFALSEAKLIALHKHDASALFCHNKVSIFSLPLLSFELTLPSRDILCEHTPKAFGYHQVTLILLLSGDREYNLLPLTGNT